VSQDVHSGSGDLAPGVQVAGYQIQERIGRGGMAAVYRALDLRLGRTVALKVLSPELGQDEAFRQRFIRESRALATVDHPHIIPVFDAGEEGGVLFIAMRHVGGGDVRSLIEAEGRLDPARVATITSQVASALDAAHAHGLIHRDVKPGNILLAQASDGRDHVYLSDFGLSKHSLNASTLTSTGQFMGTLDYVSPEQIQGQPVDGRADQYSLACTVVEMLTGAPPFRRDESMALMWAQLEATPPRLSELRADLPPAIDRVLESALAKNPGHRFPSCRAFARALSAAAERGNGHGAFSTAQEPYVPSAAAQAPPTRADKVRDDNQQPRARQTKPDDIDKGTGFARNGRPPQVRGRPTRKRRRNVILASVIVLLGLAGITGLGYEFFYHPAADKPAPAAGTKQTHVATPPAPADTVRAFFNAINAHQYHAAWVIDNKSEPFKSFMAGYAGTASDTVTILQISGDIVTARLVAAQSDGSVKTFEGTYTVVNGTIIKANVHQES